MTTRIATAAALAALAAAAGASAQGPERITEGNLVMENIPEIPSEVEERLRQYQNMRGHAFQGFDRQGGIYISTRFGETSQIHQVSEPLGMRRQITFYDEPVGGAAPQPGGDGVFAFAKDTGGDEYFQGYLYDPEDGSVEQFTEAGTRNGALSWSDDGAKLAWYRSTEADPNWDVMVAEADTPSDARLALDGEGALFPGDWSPDNSQILLQRYYSITHSDIFVLDVESGAVSEINPGADVAYGGSVFAADGESVYAITDEDTEFRRVAEFDLETGETRWITPEHGWDVSEMALSPDGGRLVYSINAGGLTEIHLIDPETGDTFDAPDLPAPGLAVGFEFDEAGETIGFTYNASVSPSDAWTFDLDTGELTRWTMAETGGLDPETFAAPELITYESFDGLEIPAFVYTPEGEGPHPVIVDIHGGPESQERPSFNSRIQYWVNELGVAVITPNVRGSAGYGKEYVTLDNGMKREDSVRDIGALLDWIEARGERFDADRVSVYGGSYGGYMVLASLVHYSDRLAGGINIVGISNFVTFLENTAGYRRDLRRPEYGDERDPEMREFLERISPLNNAEEITAPLFIIQGANDPRVPASEAEQIMEAMREQDVEAWYLLALDEGHGFRKKSNRDFQRAAETLFLQDILELD